MYPLFLMGVGAAIITVLLVWFVPEFAQIFGRMKEQGKLPWATTALMGFSEWLQDWWLGILIVVAGGIAWLVYFISDSKEAQAKN